jgi:hypothetical protein
VGVATANSGSYAAGGKGGNATSSATGGKASADSTNVNLNSTTSKGGNAKQAQGQEQGQSQIGVNEQGQSQSADNAGNSQTITYRQVQQAPGIAQGGIAIQGCATGGNAGGSNTHGAAFLGIGFTPRECYRFMLAQAVAALGDPEGAMKILETTDTARDVLKRMQADRKAANDAILQSEIDEAAKRYYATH